MLAVTMPRLAKEVGQNLKAGWKSSFSPLELHGYLAIWNKVFRKDREILYRKHIPVCLQCVHNCIRPHPEIVLVSTPSR